MYEEEKQQGEQEQFENTHDEQGQTASPVRKKSQKKPRGKKKKTGVVIALLIVAALLFGALYKAGYLDSVKEMMSSQEAVAYVNDDKITKNELQERFEPLKEQINAMDMGTSTEKSKLLEDTKKQVLNEIINEKILLSHAKQADITIEDQEVDAQLQNTKDQFTQQQKSVPGDQKISFKEQLKKAGFSEKEYRKELKKQLLMSSYIEQNVDIEGVTVTDQEIQALYDQYSQNPNIPEGQLPTFEEVRDSLEARAKQQKTREKVLAFVEELRADADIEILI